MSSSGWEKPRWIWLAATLVGQFHGAAADILIGVPLPLTGTQAWGGERTQQGAELAVAELNAAGGLLGQQVRIDLADDYCDGDQAVAAARKLVVDKVVAAIGEPCS